MKWFESIADERPTHNQTVIIKMDGSFHLAEYNTAKQVLTLNKDKKILTFKELFSWAPVTPPPE